MNRSSAPRSLARLSAAALAAGLLAAAPLPPAAAQPVANQPTAPAGAFELLTPANSVVALIDYQPQMFFGVQSHDRHAITNGVVGLAKATKVFNVPVVLSTVETRGFSGFTIPALREVLKDNKAIERTSMNSWEDAGFADAVRASGRKKLVLAGLWTEVCTVFPTLDALEEGFEVYVVTDICGATSDEAHEMAIARVVQAGAVPVTWQQVMLEWQRDWSRKETYAGVNAIIEEHSGAYGIGVGYAKTMLHGMEPANGKGDAPAKKK